jgi:hypothetical protein
VSKPQLLACVHKQEAACAVGVFRFALLEASLPDECGLLIAENSRDGNIPDRS